MHNFSVEMVSG